MYLHKRTQVVLLFFLFATASAQQVEKKFLFTLPDIFSNEGSAVDFDTVGNYCCYKWRGEGQVVTNTRTYGPFKITKGWPGMVIFYNEENNNQYFKGGNSTVLYGPIDGSIRWKSSTGINGERDFSFILKNEAGFNHYINGKLVITTNSGPCTQQWCVFSNNGHVLYTVKNNRRNFMFLDGKLIDSTNTLDDYDWLLVDDTGHFCYTLGQQRERFMPYPADRQKTFSPVAMTTDPKARESIYTGLASDSIYVYQIKEGRTILIKLHRIEFYQEYLEIVTASGKETIFLGYRPEEGPAQSVSEYRDTILQIHLNNKIVKLPYKNIFRPCIDSFGHYALFGQRGYYLFKNVNGVEFPQPLTKHGVRAKPISIDVQGNVICYYETDDSVYVYENDRLFGKCVIAHFMCNDGEPLKIYRKTLDRITYRSYRLPAFGIDSVYYIVYQNAISPAMLKPDNQHTHELPLKGDAIYSTVNEYGYCELRKTGEGSYSLTINNKRIAFPKTANFDTPILFFLTQNFSFNGNEFIFYSKEGTGIYQYKMKL